MPLGIEVPQAMHGLVHPGPPRVRLSLAAPVALVDEPAARGGTFDRGPCGLCPALRVPSQPFVELRFGAAQLTQSAQNRGFHPDQIQRDLFSRVEKNIATEPAATA